MHHRHDDTQGAKQGIRRSGLLDLLSPAMAGSSSRPSPEATSLGPGQPLELYQETVGSEVCGPCPGHRAVSWPRQVNSTKLPKAKCKPDKGKEESSWRKDDCAPLVFLVPPAILLATAGRKEAALKIRPSTLPAVLGGYVVKKIQTSAGQSKENENIRISP